MRCIRRNQVSGLVVARGISLRLPRYILIALFCAISLFAVTACSPDNKYNSAATVPPPAAVKPETVAPIPSAMDTFRALAPPDGMKFTPLFNENISDTSARIKRLEDSVQTVRNDVDTLVPTMVRMVAIEKDIKGLVAQLQTLTDQNQQGPAYVPAGTPSKLPPPLSLNGGTTIPGGDVAKGTEPVKADEAKAGPVAPSPLVTPEAASKGELPPEDAASPHSKVSPDVKLKGLDLTPKTGASVPEKKTAAAPETGKRVVAGNVVNMRISDTPEKTQLTLDVTAEASVPVKLTNKGKTLVIDLAHFNWGGKDTWESDHKELITGGTVKGGKLYVDLKRAADVKAEKMLAPSGDEKNYRLVIDLFNKKVQKAAEPKAITPAAPASQTTTPSPVQAPAAVPAPAPAPKASGENFQ
jgi:hypothetical protein